MRDSITHTLQSAGAEQHTRDRHRIVPCEHANSKVILTAQQRYNSVAQQIMSFNDNKQRYLAQQTQALGSQQDRSPYPTTLQQHVCESVCCYVFMRNRGHAMRSCITLSHQHITQTAATTGYYTTKSIGWQAN